ncbi:MAG: hypothetical protein K0R00_106 [Herbinix sp.]|jgi:predicted RNA-binding Zn-ribbon protein involved in translation (DUF1610 family)|nr:hypothetical protein [Herbinix sp.]
MKVTILLGESTQYSMELGNDKATEMYADLIKYLLMKSIQIIPEPEPECVPIIPIFHAENMQQSAKEIVSVHESADDESIPNPFAGMNTFSYKKIVAYQCPDCGQITVRFMVLGESNIAHCHFCRKEGIVIETAEIASYICEECAASAYIWVCNGLREVHCKDCKTPINLFRDSMDENKLKSAGLINKSGHSKKRR